MIIPRALNFLFPLPLSFLLGPTSLSATELDLLAALAQWIKPRADKTLPSLTIRQSVYDILMRLPCQTDHLKRHADGKQTIGMVVVALWKSKHETEENRKKLRALIDKWSRPIYGKQADTKTFDHGSNAEIRAASLAAAAASLAVAQTQAGQASLADAFSTGGVKVDTYKRVRTPYSNGFLFTERAQPRVVRKSLSLVSAPSPPPRPPSFCLLGCLYECLSPFPFLTSLSRLV